MRQRYDRTARFIFIIAGKPEASLADPQRIVMRCRLPQRFGERQRFIRFLNDLSAYLTASGTRSSLTSMTA